MDLHTLAKSWLNFTRSHSIISTVYVGQQLVHTNLSRTVPYSQFWLSNSKSRTAFTDHCWIPVRTLPAAIKISTSLVVTVFLVKLAGELLDDNTVRDAALQNTHTRVRWRAIVSCLKQIIISTTLICSFSKRIQLMLIYFKWLTEISIQWWV